MAILRTDTVSGIGTEGTVFEGDITFDNLSYMTLPKGTTTQSNSCLLYTSPSPRDRSVSRMPSSA